MDTLNQQNLPTSIKVPTDTESSEMQTEPNKVKDANIIEPPFKIISENCKFERKPLEERSVDPSNKSHKKSSSISSLRASPPPFIPRFSASYHQPTQVSPTSHSSPSPHISPSPHSSQSPYYMLCSNHSDNQKPYSVTVHIHPNAEFTVQVGEETQTIQGSTPSHKKINNNNNNINNNNKFLIIKFFFSKTQRMHKK